MTMILSYVGVNTKSITLTSHQGVVTRPVAFLNCLASPRLLLVPTWRDRSLYSSIWLLISLTSSSTVAIMGAKISIRGDSSNFCAIYVISSSATLHTHSYTKFLKFFHSYNYISSVCGSVTICRWKGLTYSFKNADSIYCFGMYTISSSLSRCLLLNLRPIPFSAKFLSVTSISVTCDHCTQLKKG